MSRATILALCTLAGPALADDFTPPPWRFGPGTTVQHWDFSAGPVVSSPPDAGPLFNPYGTPIFSHNASAVWAPALAGRNHIWGLRTGGALNFLVPNTGNVQNQKELWLQVTFRSGFTGPTPLYSVASPNGPFSLLATQTTPLNNGWFHQLTRWSLTRCPPFERITIFSSTPGTILPIDQVVIDTRCIPSPSTFSLLAGAGLLALRRRR